jgi:hypothetical protein
VAGLLLTELVADVTAGMRTRRDDGLPSLHRSTREHLTSHLDTALRLLEFYPTIRFDGVLVSVANTDEKIALENGLGVAPLFDIFNPRARAIVLGGLAAVYEPGDDVALGDWARWAAQSDRGLEVMSQQAASIGFMTLFADSLRSVVQAFMSGNASSSVDFTFHSKPPGGYQVQYHPQYYTSPVVFGPNLSTPVTKKVCWPATTISSVNSARHPPSETQPCTRCHPGPRAAPQTCSDGPWTADRDSSDRRRAPPERARPARPAGSDGDRGRPDRDRSPRPGSPSLWQELLGAADRIVAFCRSRWWTSRWRWHGRALHLDVLAKPTSIGTMNKRYLVIRRISARTWESGVQTGSASVLVLQKY